MNFCQQYGLKILMLQPHLQSGGTVGAVLEKAIAERNAVINAEQYLSELRLTAQRGSRIISTM